MLPPKAVIFDMDGTLVNSMPYHDQSWQALFKKYDLDIDQATFDRYHKGTLLEVMQRLFPKITSKQRLLEMGGEKEALYRELYRPHIKPLDGVPEFLNYLKSKGLPIALATMGNQLNIDFVLGALNIRSYFQQTVGGHQVKAGKPDPEIFLSAAEKLGVPPKDCLAFEDTVSGINAALNAGMTVIGVATQHAPDDLKDMGCHKGIHSFKEVLHGLKL